MDSENTAVSWSNYESSMNNVRYEQRMYLSKMLSNEISLIRSRGVSEHFLSGMELAKGLISGESQPLSEKSQYLGQDRLF